MFGFSMIGGWECLKNKIPTEIILTVSPLWHVLPARLYFYLMLKSSSPSSRRNLGIPYKSAKRIRRPKVPITMINISTNLLLKFIIKNYTIIRYCVIF